MVHGITGWSGGGRRPLSYELMPGQFRNSRVSIFPSQTIINNNIGGCYGGSYGYYDNCCGGNDGGIPSWCRKLLGWGMGMSFASNLMNMIFGGGSQGSEGAGGTETKKPADLQALKSDAKAYANQYGVKIDVLSDGSLLCNKKKYASLDELSDDLKDENPTPATTTPPAEKRQPAASTTTTTSVSDDNPADGVDKKAEFAKLFGDALLNSYDPSKGLKINDTYYKTAAEAFRAYSGNGAVQVEGADLNDILGKITGVYDDGKDANGKEIGDFKDAKASLDSNKQYQIGDTIKIGAHDYKLESKDGYLYLVEKSPSGGAATNPQFYMVEKVSGDNNSVTYQLHQRVDTKHNDGVGKYAH